MKKVSKYENKFAKLQKKAAEFNFRNQLKVVKKKEFTLEEEDKEVNLLSSHCIPPVYFLTVFSTLSFQNFGIFEVLWVNFESVHIWHMGF